MDDRSEYERNNDAKRHANKAFLHEHVLVRFKDTHKIVQFAQCHVEYMTLYMYITIILLYIIMYDIVHALLQTSSLKS